MKVQIKITSKLTRANVPLHQGEHNQTNVEFVVPNEMYGTDNTVLSWEVRTTNRCNGAYYGEPLESSSGEEPGVVLPWKVSNKYTGKEGPLQVFLYGSLNDEVLAKLEVSGFSVMQIDEGTTPPRLRPISTFMTFSPVMG